ncbi:hypothetical protein [Planctomicrobium sp. SH527]|uniref:hypothetical protein n=1 Tax=Planctomicrobium sp. SH527 TaxID=3448123 RepID=UPI003F5BC591
MNHQSVFESVVYIGLLGLLAALLIEAAYRAEQLKWVFAGLIYLTTALWYIIDPIYTPHLYARFTIDELDFSFAQVCVFLVGFRVLVEKIAPKTPTSILREIDVRQIDHGPIVPIMVITWALLFTIGITLTNFRVLEVLFPINSRAGSVVMFGRGRFGGATGFLMSSADYSYLAICASFGLILISTRRKATKILMLCMIAVTWPMFFMAGARNKALAIVVPTIMGTLLIKKWSRFQQLLFVGICGIVLNTVMLIAIQFRNVGFDKLIEDDQSISRVYEGRHFGLNMTEELLHISQYQRTGQLEIEWGMNYLGNILNVVPRAIWQNKPFVGRELAMLRSGTYREDISTTISYGFIGQGVSNFGPWLGPLAPALFFACYCQWLCRLPLKGNRSLRIFLIIFCLALLPNLGRDICLFVLWPVIFAYSGVTLYEMVKR